LITEDAYLQSDFAAVRFNPPEDIGFGPNIRIDSVYRHLHSYIDDLVLSSNADGRILLPHNTENALLRFLDMNLWLTSLEETIRLAREWRDGLRGSFEQRARIAELIHANDDDDAEIMLNLNDAENQVSDLEMLLYIGCERSWESLCESKRRKINENWNYRVRSRAAMICNDSTLVGTDVDDPMITDSDLLNLESVLQDHAWIFFMRTLWVARLVQDGHHETAVENEFVTLCYILGESDLLVTDLPYEEYSMQDAVTAYSLFLRATYTYPCSREMVAYEQIVAVSLARLMATPSSNPRRDYDMKPFVSSRATSHLREESDRSYSFGIKAGFFRFTDVLVFPTKLRLQTANMFKLHCIQHGESLPYPSPRTEKGYRYWRSIAYRLVKLNRVVAALEDSFFRNDFCNFPVEHIYQSGLMENELLRFSLERPGQEPDPASILETLREKDYIDLNAMAKEMPHYFCANYTHAYLKWMQDALGVDTSEFLNEITHDNEISRFISGTPLSAAAKCPPLQEACWPPRIPDISVLTKVPENLARGITAEESERVRKVIEYRPRSAFDNVAFFCYMYILNAWGRRASRQHYIYPDYVITDLIYRSDQIQEIVRKMEASNTHNTLPYLIYVCQQCYIFHRGKYEFVPNFSEAIERYIARFVSAGHVYEHAEDENPEDEQDDSDVLSVRDPYLLRHQSLLYHTDPQRKNEPTFGISPRLR